MIERNFELKGKENTIFDKEDKINETIVKLLERADSYVKQDHLRAEGQKYVLEGLLPYIYKYVSCLYNLTNFEIKSRGTNPYSKVPKVANHCDLLSNVEIAKVLYTSYKAGHHSIAEILNKNNQHTLFESYEVKMNEDD
jgi:hypothetical protein